MHGKGYGRVQIDNYFYIHHFNLESFKRNLQDLKLQFKQIKENQFSKLILDKFDEIDLNLKNLLPMKRRKRWNTLGTIWKFIAGNPDANDLKLINNSINNIIDNNNQQVRINREISLQMKEAVYKTKESISLFNSKSTEIYSINVFLNINFLNNKLEQISETIMLAKIGILNVKILSQGEIDILIRDLTNENLTVLNVAEALTYATTSIATNEREIALLIKMPKLDSRVYKKIFVLPTWFNGRQIHLSNNNYLHYGNEYYIVNSLQPNVFDSRNITLDESSCIPHLLEGKPALCDYLTNPLEDIVSIDNQHLLTNLLGNFTIRTNCGLSERNLSGTYLISFSNCEVTINNHTYSNQVHNLTGRPIHLPLYGIPIEERHAVVNLSLQHLQDMHVETRKEMEKIRLDATSMQWPHWSIFGGITVYPIVIGIVMFLGFFFHRRAKLDIQVNQQPKASEEITGFRDLSLTEIIRTEPQSEGGQVNNHRSQ